MKIAVLHRYPPKQAIGTNASFVEFLKELACKGRKVFYVTYKDRSNPDIEISDLRYMKLPFYFNRGNFLDKVIKTYLWILIVPFWVRSIRKKYGLDLVYCDDSVPFYAFLTKFFNPNLKVVMRLGDLQIGYAYFDTKPRIYKMMLVIEKFIWNRIDGIVAISEAFKKFVVDLGIDPRKVSVVEESINLDEDFKFKGIPNDDVTFLFHGSMVPCKGMITLLEAYKKVSKDHKVKLIIAGGGSEEGKIRKYIVENNLENIELTGWYDHKKLKEIMEKVDLSVVMRSPNFANNFVVTTCLLENWKFRKPTIVPNLDSFTSLIVNGKESVFYKVGDSKDLCRKMIYVIENKDKWEILTQNAYKMAQNVFYYKKIAKKMVKTILNY